MSLKLVQSDLEDRTRRTAAKLQVERARRSQELADQVKAGEYIKPPLDTMASWFPARPLIKKDERDMARVYEG